MALYDKIRSKLARQELKLDVEGNSFKQYSAKVKYLPENIEKPDFFNLCCGILKSGDIVVIRTKVDKTNKEESYDVVYKFLILSTDVEEQKVEVLQITKIDLLNPLPEVKGVDMIALNNAIKDAVDAKLKELITKLDNLTSAFETYKTDTDDQLEEIENSLAGITKDNK